MEEASDIADFKLALQSIRDAAKKLSKQDGAAAREMRYIIEDRLEVVTRNYDLHPLFQTLRREVHRACLSWLATHQEVESHQRRAALEKASLAGAEKLVRSIETLLAAMKSPGER